MAWCSDATHNSSFAFSWKTWSSQANWISRSSSVVSGSTELFEGGACCSSFSVVSGALLKPCWRESRGLHKGVANQWMISCVKASADFVGCTEHHSFFWQLATAQACVWYRRWKRCNAGSVRLFVLRSLGHWSDVCGWYGREENGSTCSSSRSPNNYMANSAHSIGPSIYVVRLAENHIMTMSASLEMRSRRHPQDSYY